MSNDTITPKQAAVRLGTMTETVQRWCRNGRLRCWKRTRVGVAFRNLSWSVEVESVERLSGGPVEIKHGVAP